LSAGTDQDVCVEPLRYYLVKSPLVVVSELAALLVVDCPAVGPRRPPKIKTRRNPRQPKFDTGKLTNPGLVMSAQLKVIVV